MDINLMVLNVGNSRLAVGVFVEGSLDRVVRVAHERREEWAEKIAEAWALVGARDGAAVAGASVNPAILEPLERVVEEVTGHTVQWVGKELELPIEVLTEKPEETGVDRVLNVAAAYEQMGKACAVVDAGSALTVDCCNDKGQFLGGAIAPGVKMMLAAMHEKTARLPAVEFEVPKGPMGTSTRQAMLQGVYHGIRGMVKELVENYATQLGYWPEVIATGGDAAALFEGWELVHAVAPDLTLYGIALAYTEHHIRQENG